MTKLENKSIYSVEFLLFHVVRVTQRDTWSDGVKFRERETILASFESQLFYSCNFNIEASHLNRFSFRVADCMDEDATFSEGNEFLNFNN